jgi:two-component system nitrogen regulation response regulator GlnG
MTKESIAKISGSDTISEILSLEKALISFEDSLFREKQGVLYDCVIDAIEKPLIEYVLERTWGNQLKAAKILGINRNTIRSKIKKLGIDAGKWKTR